MDKLGIEKLKKDVVTITKVIGKVDNSLEDGKISIGEWASLAFEIPSVIKAVKGYKYSAAELIDLDEAEAAELSVHFAKEFDIRNDAAEVIVEQILEVILTLVVAAMSLKDFDVK